MIELFIDRALIIDDDENEIEKLWEFLEENEISVKYFNPDVVKPVQLKKNRKIIFLDLFIDKTITQVEGQISKIRTILTEIIGTDFGSYGIIMWTKHEEHINSFKSKIKADNGYVKPLFIIALDKTEFLKNGDYTQIFNEIDVEIKKNIAANFFIYWSILINKGTDAAIKNIYSFFPDYSRQNSNLEYIMFQLARNYTGIPIEDTNEYPLQNDALKAFSDMLSNEILNPAIVNSFGDVRIFNKMESICFITENGQKTYCCNQPKNNIPDEIMKIYAKINFKLLFDDKIDENIVMPGNIYKDCRTVGDQKQPSETPIVIELTPPCDFAQKKKSTNSRILSGKITDIDREKTKAYSYNELKPIAINDEDNLKMISFDLRQLTLVGNEELTDSKKFKLLFRAKEKTFADILQKYSSYSARLGLAILK